MIKELGGKFYKRILIHVYKFKCPRCDKTFYSKNKRARFCSAPCHLKGNTFGHAKKGRFYGRKARIFHKSTRYYLVYKPSHPHASVSGYILEHRHVMEEKLGRILEKNEFCHHINGDRSDNRIKNLIVMTQAAHNSIHKTEEVKNRHRSKDGKFIEN